MKRLEKIFIICGVSDCIRRERGSIYIWRCDTLITEISTFCITEKCFILYNIYSILYRHNGVAPRAVKIHANKSTSIDYKQFCDVLQLLKN